MKLETVIVASSIVFVVALNDAPTLASTGATAAPAVGTPEPSVFIC